MYTVNGAKHEFNKKNKDETVNECQLLS